MDCSPPGSSSMWFSRQKYWSELPFPFPGDLPDPGIEPESPALAGGFFTAEPSGKPLLYVVVQFSQHYLLKRLSFLHCIFLPALSSACPCRRCRRPGFDPWVWTIPWSRKWQPTPVFLPRKYHRVKESNTTEQLSTPHIFPYLVSTGEPGEALVVEACPGLGGGGSLGCTGSEATYQQGAVSGLKRRRPLSLGCGPFLLEPELLDMACVP